MFEKNTVFTFRHVNKEITSLISTFNPKKLLYLMRTKIIKQLHEVFADIFLNNFNSCLGSSMFPDELKVAEVVTIYKKKC